MGDIRPLTKRFALVAALFLFGRIAATPVLAGVADSPLPVLDAGKKTYHVYSVPGTTGLGGLGTFFSCTSTDTATIQVGVEIFPPAGGAPCNDATATSLSVLPGVTVIFGTTPAAGISVSSSLGGCGTSKGSTRILATSKQLICTAFIADIFNVPPLTTWQLTIVKKMKQKGD